MPQSDVMPVIRLMGTVNVCRALKFLAESKMWCPIHKLICGIFKIRNHSMCEKEFKRFSEEFL